MSRGLPVPAYHFRDCGGTIARSSDDRDVLYSQGLYIPLTGRTSPDSGHHNIAFQLNSDSRYDACHGNLSDLMTELALAKPSRVCLSSEEFEYLFTNTDALRSFLLQCSELNYKVKVLFFLRPQADYAESLYVELVKCGLCISFDEFLQSFISEGIYRYGSRWWNCSDYNLLLDKFASIFGKNNIIVCRYLNSLELDQIIIKLLAQICPELSFNNVHYKLSPRPENVSVSFPDVVRRYVQNKVNETKQEITVEKRRTLPNGTADGDYSGSFEPIDIANLLRFCKFVGPNLRVFWKYGVFLPFVSAKILQRELKIAFTVNHKSKGKRLLLKHLARETFLPPSLDLESKFELAPNVWKNGENILESVTTVNCSLSGVLLKVINADPQIILPIGLLGCGRTRYLQFELIFESQDEAQPDVAIQVFWMTENEPSFEEKNSCWENLRTGVNKYTFALPPDATGFIRLDPVNIPGNYMLSFLSLRSE